MLALAKSCLSTIHFQGPFHLTDARMDKSNSGYGPELQLFRYYGKRAIGRRGLILRQLIGAAADGARY
jgi:hypothetical protein